MDTSEEHRVACGSWLELAVSPLCVVREKYNQFIYVKPLVPNVSALLSNVRPFCCSSNDYTFLFSCDTLRIWLCLFHKFHIAFDLL